MSVGFERKMPVNLITKQDLRQIFIDAVMDAFHPDQFNMLARLKDHKDQVIAAEKICSDMLQKNGDKKIYLDTFDFVHLKSFFVESLVDHWGSIRELYEGNAFDGMDEIPKMREIATNVATRTLENLSL